MRLPVLTLEAHRDVGECSKEEIGSWGAIVSEYTSEECGEDWPPAEYWSLSAEEEREGSVRPT